MGSGTFPLNRYDRNFIPLLEAYRLVKSVLDDMYGDVYSGDSGGMQYDNAASDGGSLALLNLAAQLIREELRKDHFDEAMKLSATAKAAAGEPAKEIQP